MSHPDPRRITALAEGRLAAAEAPEVRRHLLACAACRRRLTARRPEALFALLREEPPAPVHWGAFRTRLRAGLEAEIRRSSRRRRWWGAAAAAAAAAALALAALWPGAPWRGPAEPAPARAARGPEAAPGEVSRDELALALEERILRRARPGLSSELSPPPVEAVESRSAQVIDLGTVPEAEMHLVLIVDEEMEL